MRSKVCLILALMGAVGACGGDDDESSQQQNAGATARRDSVVRRAIYPEAEAAQILRTINTGEVATSRVARERSQNDDILNYASVMIADHSAMTALLDSLLPPISDSANAESRQWAQLNAQLVDSLQSIEGGFNNTYIQEQIAAHERTLVLMDTALIPSARTPQVKKLLQDLRPAVIAHLQRARQIWSERQASGAAAATAAAAAAARRSAPAPTTPAPVAAPAPAPTPETIPAPPPPPPDTLAPVTTSNME